MPSPLSLLARRGGRLLPWVRYYAIARQILRRGQAAYQALTPQERTELQRIVRESGGRPGRVSAHDRAELQRLVRKGLAAAARRR